MQEMKFFYLYQKHKKFPKVKMEPDIYHFTNCVEADIRLHFMCFDKTQTPLYMKQRNALYDSYSQYLLFVLLHSRIKLDQNLVFLGAYIDKEGNLCKLSSKEERDSKIKEIKELDSQIYRNFLKLVIEDCDSLKQEDLQKMIEEYVSQAVKMLDKFLNA